MILKTNQLMTYKAKVAVCTKIRTKHLTQGEQHVEFFNVKTWWYVKKPLCLTLNLLTTTIVAPSSNPSKWQMAFNSVFKGLNCLTAYLKDCNFQEMSFSNRQM
jgi:hypothetical protein